MTNFSYPSCENKSFWGLIAHLRWWMEFDGTELNFVKCENSGKLNSDNVRRIARNYSVFRGTKLNEIKLTGNKKSETPAEWLARIINEFDCSKHISLEEKAKWCAEKAREAATDNFIRRRQVSGMTKLLWFRCQEDWTPYDMHASSAVGLADYDTLTRMEKFYKILADRHFCEYAKQIDKILRKEGFEELYGSRVIDNFLMLNSTHKTWPIDTIKVCCSFLNCLPYTLRESVVRVGKKMPKDINKLVNK